MRAAYVQCANGVSGDMLLGALLDAGASLQAMQRAVDAVFPDRTVQFSRQEVQRAGIRATLVSVGGGDAPAASQQDDHGHTPLSTLIERVQRADLAAPVVASTVAVLERIGQAESRVHGGTPENVGLAELGAADTLADIVGAIVGLESLGVESVWASGLPLGSGRVRTQHGLLPVPVPGVLEMMRMAGAPTLPGPADPEPTGEIVTPTGAAIVTTLASFGAPPAMTSVEAVGYGAGSRDPDGRANVVTVIIGETTGQQIETTPMVMVETTIDDMNPEVYDYARQRLMAAGAKDVWLTPVQMKKGRPGVIISAIGPQEAEATLASVMLRETTTLGVRVTPVTRYEAAREIVPVQTPLGEARVKIKRLHAEGEIIGIAPEYDDCLRIAQEQSIPVQRVYQIVSRAAEDALLDGGRQDRT